MKRIYEIILPSRKLCVPEKSEYWLSHLMHHLDRKSAAPRYLWTPSRHPALQASVAPVPARTELVIY